jgi:hypothetical protein
LTRSLREIAQAIDDLGDAQDFRIGRCWVIEGGDPSYVSCVFAFPGGYRWLRVAKPGESAKDFHGRVAAEAEARGGRMIRWGGLPKMPVEGDDPEALRAEKWWRVP